VATALTKFQNMKPNLSSISPPFRVSRPLESIASKKRHPFMTLIVAAKSKNAVVFAADSQISFDHSALRTDVKKIERIEFKNFPAMVALAEDVTNAFRYIVILREMAVNCAPTSADEAAMVVQRAMEKLRREVAQTYAGENKDLEMLIKERGLNASITVGFCLNYEPYIVTTNLLRPTAIRSRAEYETDGCGSPMANFILAEYFTPKSDLDNTALIAIYAVWSVIKYDRYCKGPILVWIACPPGGLSNGEPRSRVIEFTRQKTDDLISIVEEIDAATKSVRTKVISDAFEARAEAFKRWLEKEIASIPPPTEAELQIEFEEIEYHKKRDIANLAERDESRL
jgi:20S proteasome alpha/beta subunit